MIESDIRDINPDLIIPVVCEENPSPGKRVFQKTVGYKKTSVYHVLYLPEDWTSDKQYPIIVEYAGNKTGVSEYGDISTGKVEDSKLGYGLTKGKGAIWLCLPYVDKENTGNVLNWWGDVESTVSYCMQTINQVCNLYRGDREAIVLAGFSRGAIACNYIGLHDDAISKIWKGFIAYSHYDGVIQWPYEGSGVDSALKRLQRLKGRSQFICHEKSVKETKDYLRKYCPDGDFQFQNINFRNHNDAWILRDVPERKILRYWLNELLKPHYNF
jgi:hypothetical protein